MNELDDFYSASALVHFSNAAIGVTLVPYSKNEPGEEVVIFGCIHM